jgi:hypothetical protein
MLSSSSSSSAAVAIRTTSLFASTIPIKNDSQFFKIENSHLISV